MNHELLAPAEICLEKHSNNECLGWSVFRSWPDIDLPGSRAIPAFEFIANHAGTASDGALLHVATMSIVDGMPDILRLDMKSIDVVKPSVPRFRDNRQAPPISRLIG